MSCAQARRSTFVSWNHKTDVRLWTKVLLIRWHRRPESSMSVQAEMSIEADCCPYCRTPLEIVCVKFRFGSAVTISCCPNCAIASADELRASPSRSLDMVKESARVMRRWWAGARRMEEAINSRVKYTLAFLLGAVIVAAMLRHTAHVYGGFSREEIRAGALLALPAAVWVMVLVRKHRRH
jgi:hypothetical protein